MNSFKSHISLFLLGLFLFPQVNNSLHYFVIEHHYKQNNTNEKQFAQDHKSHDCQQSIFKIPNVLLFHLRYAERLKTLVQKKINDLFFISIYTKTIFKNLSDRGPPAT